MSKIDRGLPPPKTNKNRKVKERESVNFMMAQEFT
jgi:hypothetical protein